MKKGITNVAASVHARLLNRAKAEGRPFNEVLQHYAMERFLYRLSRSEYADRFVLKGALMLQFWDLRKGRIQGDVPDLDEVAARIESFLMPVVTALTAGQAFTHRWPPGGPWGGR
jgi:hypothetical protein